MSELKEFLKEQIKQTEDRIRDLTDRTNKKRAYLDMRNREDNDRVNEFVNELNERGENLKEWEYEIISLSDYLANQTDEDYFELDEMKRKLEDLNEDLMHFKELYQRENEERTS